jgi:ribonucleoside-diphosphate reductase alpha chain
MKTRYVDVKITSPDKGIVFQKDNFEIPEGWSDRAAKVVASKYAMDSENSAIQIIDRVVNQISIWGENQGYFNSGTNLEPYLNNGTYTEEEFRYNLKDILINQRASFNSPVWFNCGSDTGTEQMSACFIVPVEDSMESILEHNTIEGLIFRGGSGAGCNVSQIRGKGEKLSNKGRTSGPLSFMRIWDTTAGAIKSGGKTRRSAKMVCMDADHPDIMEFINCKKDEENKAKILIDAGMNPEEAYATVAFQNTNHSIRVTDKFMQCVVDDKEWGLINRGDKVVKQVSARDLLYQTARIAWETGDPGIQFDDRMNKDNPVPSVDTIHGTNPCFTGDTRISTPNGLIPIKELCDLALNKGVISPVYTENEIISMPVAYGETGSNDILKVTLSDGREIKCTPNHNWYIEGKKIEAKDLEIGMPVNIFTGTEIKSSNLRRSLNVKKDINDYAIKNCKKIEGANFPTEMTPEFAEVLGHLTGDGYVSEGSSYSVGWVFGTHKEKSQDLDDLYDRYKKVLDSFFPVNTSVNKNGCKLLRYNRIPIVKYFIDLGFSRCKAPQKRVPEFLFRSDNEIIKNYLRGYFGADGTAYGVEEEHSCSINCSSVSKKLLQDIQLLLDIFGIRSQIKLSKKAGTITFKGQKTYKTHATYRLLIDVRDLNKFQERIGFSVKYKNDTLEFLLNNRRERFQYKYSSVVISSIEALEEKEITYNLTEPINNLVYAQGVLIAQCSEFSAIDNSSCNLASLNLIKYWDNEYGFQWDNFEEDIKVLITAMDILVDAADYPTQGIREVTTSTRPLGLGFANLGALLMSLTIPYDSEEARDFASDITRNMTTYAYNQSISLAKKMGSFKHFADNMDANIEIAKRLTGDTTLASFMEAYGLRNSQLTLLAPCGTIGFMMDCDTTGIEPLFALKTVKTLAGGGVMELDYPCVQEAVKELKKGYKSLKDLSEEEIIEKHPDVFQTANELPWKAHADMMAACQKHLNSAISKTVNFSSDCTIDDVFDSYIYAWKAGLKAIAIYRDGSKGLQPMVSATKKTSKKVLESSTKSSDDFVAKTDLNPVLAACVPTRLKPSDEHKGIIHSIDISGHKVKITVGLYEDGSVAELYISMSKEGSTLSGIMDGLARSVSLGIQYGVPLKVFVNQFKDMKFEPAGVTRNPDIVIAHSILDYIGRWLEKRFLSNKDDNDNDEDEQVVYDDSDTQVTMKRSLSDFSDTEIKEIQKQASIAYDGPPCPECGNFTFRSGTCYLCATCGSTTGCS